VRKIVVNHICSIDWDILLQIRLEEHLEAYPNLRGKWNLNPKGTYFNLMSIDGTYGTQMELEAASEVLNFNFVIIQQYMDEVTGEVVRYRMETGIKQANLEAPIFFFLFTGDYKGGHWEKIESLNGVEITDGVYVPNKPKRSLKRKHNGSDSDIMGHGKKTK